MKNKIYDISKYDDVISLAEQLVKDSNFLDKGHAISFFNVVKYLLRSPYKGKLEDLRKAKDYLDRLVGEFDNNTTNGELTFNPFSNEETGYIIFDQKNTRWFSEEVENEDFSSSVYDAKIFDTYFNAAEFFTSFPNMPKTAIIKKL